MSWTNWWSTTEQDVIALISKAKTDTIAAEKDINNALKWISAETPAIVGGLQTALQIASMFGVVTAPELAAANAAVTALNAFANAQNTGKNDVQSVVNGYIAYTQAASAVNSAKAAAVSSVRK